VAGRDHKSYRYVDGNDAVADDDEDDGHDHHYLVIKTHVCKI